MFNRIQNYSQKLKIDAHVSGQVHLIVWWIIFLNPNLAWIVRIPGTVAYVQLEFAIFCFVSFQRHNMSATVDHQNWPLSWTWRYIKYNYIEWNKPDWQNASIVLALKLNCSCLPLILLISIIVPSCLNPSLRRKPPYRSEYMTPKTPFLCVKPDLSVRGETAKRISFLNVWWKFVFLKKSSVACLIVESDIDSFLIGF